MELGSNVKMQIVVYKAAFGVDMSKVEAKVTYYSHDTTVTEPIVKTINGADFLDHTNGRAKVNIDWLDIPDGNQTVTVEFFADGVLVGTVTESLTAALGVYVSVLPDQELWPAMVKFMNSSYAALH